MGTKPFMSLLPVDCLSLIFQSLDLTDFFTVLQVSKSMYRMAKNIKELRLEKAVRIRDLKHLWPQADKCPILSGTIVSEYLEEEYLEGLRYQTLKVICLGYDVLPLGPKFRNLVLQAIVDHSKTLIISSMQGFDLTFTQGYLPHPRYLGSVDLEIEDQKGLSIKGIRCAGSDIGDLKGCSINGYTDFWIYPERGGYGQDVAEVLGKVCPGVKKLRCDYHLGSVWTLCNLPNLEEFRGVVSLEEFMDIYADGCPCPLPPSLKVIGVYLENLELMERWNSGSMGILMSYYLYVPEEIVDLVRRKYGDRKGLLEVVGIPKTVVGFEC